MERDSLIPAAGAAFFGTLAALSTLALGGMFGAPKSGAIVLALRSGSTVSDLCSSVPQEYRGASLAECSRRVLRENDIRNERRMPSDMRLRIPVAAHEPRVPAEGILLLALMVGASIGAGTFLLLERLSQKKGTAMAEDYPHAKDPEASPSGFEHALGTLRQIFENLTGAVKSARDEAAAERARAASATRSGAEERKAREAAERKVGELTEELRNVVQEHLKTDTVVRTVQERHPEIDGMRH